MLTTAAAARGCDNALRVCSAPLLSSARLARFGAPGARHVVSTTASDNDDDPHHRQAARNWLARLTPETFPVLSSGDYQETYSTSSGPGGQNVNKVNSKATLSIEASALFPKVPALLHQAIRKSPYFKPASDRLVIQSDKSRKQSDNRKECWSKLHNLLVEAGQQTIPGETSDAQKKRVKDLKRTANESRLRHKKVLSDKKSSRKSGKGPGDY